MSKPELSPGDRVLVTFTKYGETRIDGPFEIERETKTLLIVNGGRFRKKDHQEYIARDAWSGLSEIIKADSDEAKTLLNVRQLRNARGEFRESVTRQNSNRTDLENALDSREKLNRYIKLLERITR